MVSGGSGSDLDADLLDATKTGIISNKPRFMK